MNDVQYDEKTDEPTDAWLVESVRDEREPDSDVERLISSISAGLSRVRRPARDIAADARGVWVSDRVLKQQIAVSARRRLGRLVVFVAVDGAQDTVDGVRIGLIAKYGDDLIELSDRVRDIVEAVLLAALGEQAAAAGVVNITVRWQDLYTREWLD